MGRLRVTVAGLMGVVVVAGIGLAALRNASEAWAGAVLLLTLGLLAAAIPGAVHGRGAGRAWWFGFALFGWGYAAMALAPWSSPDRLPTRALLDGLYAAMSPREVMALESFAAAAMSDEGRVLDPSPPQGSWPETVRASDAVVAVGTLDPRAFRAIGQDLLALAAAVLGGLIAGRFHAGRGPVEPPWPMR